MSCESNRDEDVECVRAAAAVNRIARQCRSSGTCLNAYKTTDHPFLLFSSASNSPVPTKLLKAD